MKHIRAHLGTKIRERISLRDLPEGPHAESEENELWLYDNEKPVRKLTESEASAFLQTQQ